MGDGHPDTIISLEGLLDVSTRLGLWQRVRPLGITILDHREKTVGENHPTTLSALKDLSSAHAHLGDWKAVQQVSCRLLGLCRKESEEAEETLAAKSTLAFAYWNQSRWNEAEALQLQIVRSYQKKCGETSLITLEALAALARTYKKQTRLSEAEDLERQVIEERKKQLGDSDALTIEAMFNLSETFIARELWHDAECLISTVAKEWGSRYGEVSPEFIAALKAKERICSEQGRRAEAEDSRKRVRRPAARLFIQKAC